MNTLITKYIVDKRLIRYLFSGGSAFLTEYLIFLVLFYVAKSNITTANILSFISGFGVSFLLNRSWVFKSSNQHYRIKTQIIYYVGLGIFNLVFSTISVNIIHNYTPGYLAKMSVVVLIAVWNYTIYKKVLFREKT